MKDLKSSVLIFSKEDIKKWLGYVVLQKESTKFSSLIEKTIIPGEGKKKKIFFGFFNSGLSSFQKEVLTTQMS